MPTSNSQRNPPALRLNQANTRWAPALKTRSQATKTLIAIPAAIGDPIARTPARIMSTLRPIDQPTDFFTKVAASISSSSSWSCCEPHSLRLRTRTYLASDGTSSDQSFRRIGLGLDGVPTRGREFSTRFYSASTPTPSCVTQVSLSLVGEAFDRGAASLDS